MEKRKAQFPGTMKDLERESLDCSPAGGLLTGACLFCRLRVRRHSHGAAVPHTDLLRSFYPWWTQPDVEGTKTRGLAKL
jgi:hypothetical protein